MRPISGQVLARLRRPDPPRSPAGTRGKVWFKASEMECAGLLRGRTNSSFLRLAEEMGWTQLEHEGELWRWVSWGGRRRKFWHLERCQKALTDVDNSGQTPFRAAPDPAWRSVPDLASLEVPVLTKSPPSIRARLKSLGLLAARAEGTAWRYDVRADARQPKKQLSLHRLLKRLRQVWRRMPAQTDAELEARRQSVAILEWALQGGGLRIR